MCADGFNKTIICQNNATGTMQVCSVKELIAGDLA
jgi:hypothetical protein